MQLKNKRPNYYILLELSYDPPEMDVAIIKEALQTKIHMWNKSINHPRKGPKFSEYRQLIPDIHRIMLGENEMRIAEAIEAKLEVSNEESEKQNLEAAYIQKAIEILYISRRLTHSAIQEVANKYHVSNSTVMKMIPSEYKISEDTPIIEPKQMINKQKVVNIINLLKLLNIRSKKGTVPTIYDYLNMADTTSTIVLNDKVTEISHSLLRKTISATVDYQKDLCGEIKTILKSDEERAKYDASIQQFRFQSVTSLIDILGERGTIDTSSYEKLLLYAQNEGLTEQQAHHQIYQYCTLKRYAIITEQVSEKVECSSCKTLNDVDANWCTNCGNSMKIDCIMCEHKNSISATVCDKCTCSFEFVGKYKQHIKNGVEFVRNDDFSLAIQQFDEATELYQTQEVKQLVQSTNLKHQLFKTNVNQIKKHVKACNIYAAHKLLVSLNTIPTELVSIKNTVDDVIHKIDDLKNSMNKLNEIEQLKEMQMLCNLCVDSKWLNKQIFKTDLYTPINLMVKKQATGIELSWETNDPRDGVRYKIYRTEQKRNFNYTIDYLIGETDEKQYIDKNAMPETSFWYYVVSYHGRHKSNTAAITQYVGTNNKLIPKQVESSQVTIASMMKKVQHNNQKSQQQFVTLLQKNNELGYALSYNESQYSFINGTDIAENLYLFGFNKSVPWKKNDQISKDDFVEVYAELSDYSHSSLLFTEFPNGNSVISDYIKSEEMVLVRLLPNNKLEVVGVYLDAKIVTPDVTNLIISEMDDHITLQWQWTQKMEHVVICCGDSLNYTHKVIITKEIYDKNHCIKIRRSDFKGQIIAVYTKSEQSYYSPGIIYQLGNKKYEMTYSYPKKGFFGMILDKDFKINVQLDKNQTLVPGFTLYDGNGEILRKIYPFLLNEKKKLPYYLELNGNELQILTYTFNFYDLKNITAVIDHDCHKSQYSITK